jgi:hypothetical protein
VITNAAFVITKAHPRLWTVHNYRPEQRNSLTQGLMQGLHRVLDAAEADPAGRLLILTGRQNFFCTAMDFAEASQATGPTHPLEQQRFGGLPATQRLTAFFHGWTRKEAYIKAQGRGLSLPLDQFTGTLAPDETPRLVSTAHAPDEVTRGSLQFFTPAPG